MKTWSLNAKFSAVLSIFILAAAGIAIIALVRINSVNDSLNNLVGVVAQRVFLSQAMLERTSAIRNQEKVFILEESKEGKQKVGQNLDAIEADLRKGMDSYRALANEAGKRNLEKMEKVLAEWKEVSLQMRSLSMQGREAEATALARGKSKEALENFGDELEAIEKRNRDEMESETLHTDEVVAGARNMILISSSCALTFGIFLAFLIMRALNRSIDEVISNLDDNSAQVTSAAQQIASSSHELSQAATEQASALEQTASSIQELSSMVQKNTDNANQASNVSGVSHKNAEHGKKVVDDMIVAIQAINESNTTIMQQIERSNNEIAQIVHVINEIGNKTKVINDIVFQTKLLSFNASVEAARAGEHGKGFAVVAEEVGTLAQMSGNAAKEISSLLEGSIQKVEQIVNETKSNVGSLVAEGRKRVEEGTTVAQQCGDVLQEIVGNVGNLNRMSSEIAQASGEQSQGVQEITKAMAQLDQVTQINAATSEESASASEELSAQAQSLRRVVETLVVTIKGAGGRTSSREVAFKPSSKENVSVPRQAKSNVVPLQTGPVNLKKASGAEDLGAVPSGDDTRFRDV